MTEKHDILLYEETGDEEDWYMYNNITLFSEYSDIVSLPEFCAMMNICRSSGYKLLKSGEIAYMKMGRKILIPKQNIVNYIASKTNL